MSTTTLHRTVHLGGGLPKTAITKSQIYQNHAQISKAATLTQRIVATIRAYHPDPGTSGVPTISDGKLSPSRFVTRSWKQVTVAASVPLPVLCSAVPTGSWSAETIPLVRSPWLSHARSCSDTATLLAELGTSDACRSLFTGLDSVVWQGNRQAIRSGSSVVHAVQLTCKQYVHWYCPICRWQDWQITMSAIMPIISGAR